MNCLICETPATSDFPLMSCGCCYCIDCYKEQKNKRLWNCVICETPLKMGRKYIIFSKTI